MTAANRRAFAVLLAVTAALFAFGVWKVTTYAGQLGAPSLSVSPLVGWLLVPAAWVGGAMNRGRAHGKTIRRSHFAAIKGKGLALLLLVVAAAITLGGSR